MMDAYIASVPVHLLTALQMIKQKNIKIVIYIMSQQAIMQMNF